MNDVPEEREEALRKAHLLAEWIAEPPRVGGDVGLAVPKQRALGRSHLALEAQLEEARDRISGLEAAYEVQREAAGWLMGERYGR